MASDPRPPSIAELQAENAELQTKATELSRQLANALERNAELERRLGGSSSHSAGFVAWLTGLPCSGKSTLARRLAEELASTGIASEILDGDAVREHLSRDLGYSKKDRDTNVLRIGFVASLVARQGVPVIVAAVSPYRETRDRLSRELDGFVEIFVDCPLEVCEERDVKGMYAEARAGRRAHFTGIDDPYEPPLSPAVTVHTSAESIAESVEKIMATLVARGLLHSGRQRGE